MSFLFCEWNTLSRLSLQLFYSNEVTLLHFLIRDTDTAIVTSVITSLFSREVLIIAWSELTSVQNRASYHYLRWRCHLLIRLCFVFSANCRVKVMSICTTSGNLEKAVNTTTPIRIIDIALKSHRIFSNTRTNTVSVAQGYLNESNANHLSKNFGSSSRWVLS